MRTLQRHEYDLLVNGCARLAEDPSIKVVFDLMRQNYADLILATDAGDTVQRELLYNAAKGLDALQNQIDKFALGDIVDTQE